MKIDKYTTYGQAYILPFIKITYDKSLYGEYEFIFGWLNVEITISFEPKQTK